MNNKDKISHLEKEKKFNDNYMKLDNDTFFSVGTQFLDILQENKIGDDERMIIDYILNNQGWDLIPDIDLKTGYRTIYFYSQLKEKYVLFNYDTFFDEMASHMYDTKFLKKVFSNLHSYSIIKYKSNKKDIDKKIDYLDNSFQFLNKHIYYNEMNHQLEMSDDKKPANIYLDYEIKDLDNVVVNQIKTYLKHLVGNKSNVAKYLLYCLSTIFLPNYKVEKMFWFIGEGGIGKSELLKYLSSLIGDDHTSSVPLKDLTSTDKNYTIAQLNGSILNICDESEKRVINETGILKSLISGKNYIMADIKNINPIRFKGKAKLFVASNKEPIFKEFDSGDKRRNILIPFEFGFPQDYDFRWLHKKDIKEQFVNLLLICANHLVQGVYDLDRDKPQEIKDMEKVLKSPKDELFHWLQNDCQEFDFVDMDGETQWISISMLESSFKKYMTEMNRYVKIDYKTIIGELRRLGWIIGEPVKRTAKKINYYQLTSKFLERVE